MSEWVNPPQQLLTNRAPFVILTLRSYNRNSLANGHKCRCVQSVKFVVATESTVLWTMNAMTSEQRPSLSTLKRYSRFAKIILIKSVPGLSVELFLRHASTWNFGKSTTTNRFVFEHTVLLNVIFCVSPHAGSARSLPIEVVLLVCGSYSSWTCSNGFLSNAQVANSFPCMYRHSSCTYVNALHSQGVRFFLIS